MDGEFSADSPSGLEGDLGEKISFTITVYSNERMVKDLHYENLTSASQIKTLAITGSQSRDEAVLGSLTNWALP